MLVHLKKCQISEDCFSDGSGVVVIIVILSNVILVILSVVLCAIIIAKRKKKTKKETEVVDEDVWVKPGVSNEHQESGEDATYYDPTYDNMKD